MSHLIVDHGPIVDWPYADQEPARHAAYCQGPWHSRRSCWRDRSPTTHQYIGVSAYTYISNLVGRLVPDGPACLPSRPRHNGIQRCSAPW